MPKLDKAEYIRVDNRGFVRYGIYIDTRTTTLWDSHLDAKYNTGEVQGYWGTDIVEHGSFEKEINSFLPPDKYLEENYTDKDIIESEKQIFKEFVRFLIYDTSSDAKHIKRQLNELKSELETIQGKLNKFKDIEQMFK